MKSRRRAPRSRAVGWLNALWEFVIVTTIYLGPPLICAAPLLFLYWLYRPVVLANPGLGALKVPVVAASLLPPSRLDFREDIGTSTQAALADLEEEFDAPEPTDKKSKNGAAPGGSLPMTGRRSSRLAGSAGRVDLPHNVSAAIADPGQYSAMSRGPASAYAYAANQRGRYRW